MINLYGTTLIVQMKIPECFFLDLISVNLNEKEINSK